MAKLQKTTQLWVLVVVVLLDLLAVSLVVLAAARYRELGVGAKASVSQLRLLLGSNRRRPRAGELSDRSPPPPVAALVRRHGDGVCHRRLARGDLYARGVARRRRPLQTDDDSLHSVVPCDLSTSEFGFNVSMARKFDFHGTDRARPGARDVGRGG